MEDAKFLSKLLQTVGAIIAIAGLAGEARIRVVDGKIRQFVKQIQPLRFLSSTFNYSRNIVKNLSQWGKKSLLRLQKV